MRLEDFYPTVIAFEPTLATESVSVRPEIVVRFNTDLMAGQINSDIGINSVIILVEENSDTTVQVEFVSYSQKILKFTPAEDLNPGSVYQVTILKDLQSSDGRTARANRSFVFRVTGTGVPKVVLRSPADVSALSSLSTFSWNSVSVSGASSGSIYYNIQVDKSPIFDTLGSNGWTTLVNETSVIPGIALDVSNAYFWRVRAEFITSGASAFGPWSDIRQFYYGSFLDPSPSTRQTYPSAIDFGIETQSIQNGLSNLSSWPTLRFVFGTAIDPSTVNTSNIILYKSSVDGYPNADRTTVNINLSVSASSLTVTPVDTILGNSRYTLEIGTGLKDVDGNSIPYPLSYYFTSRFSPLYVGLNAVRANFGGIAINYPDDLLNTIIFRASLDVNRMYIITYNMPWGGPTEEQVRNLAVRPTYDMERWVEIESAVRILTMKYYELLEEADSSKRLGDFEEKHGVGLLQSISGEIDRLKKLATQWLVTFSRNRAVPSSVVKSSRWPTTRRRSDLSWRDYRRNSGFE